MMGMRAQWGEFMKRTLVSLCVLAAGLCVAAPSIADTLAYPNSDDASFVLDYPSNWEVEPGEEVGDYVTLNAPTGAVLQLRTIPGTESAVADATEETVAYLGETFDNVQLGEPQDVKQGAVEGSLLVGSGVDDDGQNVKFAMYYIGLPDGNIAVIWYAVVEGDEEGNAGAVKILNSFRAP